MNDKDLFNLRILLVTIIILLLVTNIILLHATITNTIMIIVKLVLHISFAI